MRIFYLMKGYYIEITNNLLDPKHRKAMRESVWLFMWLLDRMTSINEEGVGKVLGGKPIKFQEVNEDLDTDERTYRRWIVSLKKGGYINTLRTPYGLVITVNKAKKVFGKRDRTKMTYPDMPHLQRDMPQMYPRTYKSGTSNKTIQDNTKDIPLKITEEEIQKRNTILKEMKKKVGLLSSAK